MGEITDNTPGQTPKSSASGYGKPLPLDTDPPLHSEARIQQSIFMYYNNTYCLAHHNPRSMIFAIPNEGNWMLQQVGLVAGASDLVLFHRTADTAGAPPRVIFMEVKTPVGKQSSKQAKFEAHVRAMGMEYCIVRSLDGAKAVVAGQTEGIQGELPHEGEGGGNEAKL